MTAYELTVERTRGDAILRWHGRVKRKGDLMQWSDSYVFALTEKACWRRLERKARKIAERDRQEEARKAGRLTREVEL